jgi:hypothetical protein
VPLCVPEDRSELASREAGLDSAIIVWWATRVECASAIARLRRVGELTTEAEGRALASLNRLVGLWHEIDPSDRVRSQAAVLLRRHPLRAADALQLAAAVDWAGSDPTDRGFVTFDDRLANAAALEGFTVIGGA